MANAVVNSYFPSQVASDVEKAVSGVWSQGRASYPAGMVFKAILVRARYRSNQELVSQVYDYTLEVNRVYKNIKMSCLLTVIYLILI